MHFDLQSCEIVGILPAEEAALKRALQASLVPESSKRKKDNVTPADKIKSDVIEIISDDPYIDCTGLSSPDLSDQEMLNGSPFNFRQSGASGNSHLSSPQSTYSTNSLHLFLSSSPWITPESSSSSSDSLFSPWSPNLKSKSSKRAASKGKTKKGAGTDADLKSKRTLEFGKSEKAVLDGKRPKSPAKLKGKGRVPTARKSAFSKETTPKDNIYQAQRKFAANHTPPIR